MISWSISVPCLVVCVYALHPSQQVFSHLRIFSWFEPVHCLAQGQNIVAPVRMNQSPLYLMSSSLPLSQSEYLTVLLTVCQGTNVYWCQINILSGVMCLLQQQEVPGSVHTKFFLLFFTIISTMTSTRFTELTFLFICYF